MPQRANSLPGGTYDMSGRPDEPNAVRSGGSDKLPGTDDMSAGPGSDAMRA
ncbi:MAG: hypothetical protein QGH94_00385 [Phycisphaerae bacterium]|nr:hypothetical protein [Phycisphaerae bacterium]